MSTNPILNDKHLSASSLASSRATDEAFGEIIDNYDAPAMDRFRISGVISKTLLLLGLLTASAVVGWNLVDAPEPGVGVAIPGVVVVGFLVRTDRRLGNGLVLRRIRHEIQIPAERPHGPSVPHFTNISVRRWRPHEHATRRCPA